MAYIWINPVTDSMYEEKVLNDFLRKHGYHRIETNQDWMAVVKEKYRSEIQKDRGTVLDMRCPKIRTLLEEIGEVENVVMPEINPILIHCGQEAGERNDLKGKVKIVTTPCQALADMGNRMELKDTRFVSWNTFLEELGSRPDGRKSKKSPIPPGFFDELEQKTESVTGKKEICDFFQNQKHKDFQLVELLYCKDGCHNGDGVVGCYEKKGDKRVFGDTNRE